MSEPPQGRCRERGCTAGTGGACIENLTPAECPNFVVGEPEEGSDAPNGPIVDESSDERIPVRGGDAFSAAEVDAFLRETPGPFRTVAIVGDPAAGKTTLVASIYELVRAQRFDLAFAGSATLKALEQRCHLSRTASGGTSAATLRTRLSGGLSFLHLRLVKDVGKPVELILADRPGEDFETVLERPAAVEALTELSRFDIVALLLDAGRLGDPTRRQALVARTRRLWLAMAEAGQLEGGRRFQLILTKLDELDGAPHQRAAQDLFERLKHELTERSPMVELEAFQVAARPRVSGGLPFGYGVEALTASWLRERPPLVYQPQVPALGNGVFDRLNLSVMGVPA